MSTPYQDIYDLFLSGITNYQYSTYSEDELDNLLLPFLIKSIAKFKKCKTDLSNRDDILMIFHESLDDTEKDILAHLMLVEYLTPKLNADELLQQSLSTKDYKLYSQANHIKEVRETRNTLRKEANNMMIKYTYDNRALDDME